ncbi:MAG: hypothetical protein JXA82_17865 [Sedimentisphaerales bacterium]|nr:hypothetical protein [Sedimentisphaerales bacterium]
MIKEYDPRISKEYFDQYWKYTSTLRQWFVAFGIGGAVILLTGPSDLLTKIGSCAVKWLFGMLSLGILSQVFISGLNKYVHWWIYWGNENEEFRTTLCYRLAEQISVMFLIDIIADIISFVAFAIASIILVCSVC